MTSSLAVPIQQLAHAKGLDLPAYATPGSAGLDLAAAIPEDQPVMLKPMARALVPTGLVIALPAGFEAQVRPRSGLAARAGITVLNTPGTIDSDYRGEIQVILINFGSELFTVARGMRIAQLVVAEVATAHWQERDNGPLDGTTRGEGGFGSTG